MNSALTTGIGTNTISGSIGSVTVDGMLFDNFQADLLTPGLNSAVWRRGERDAAVNTTDDDIRINFNTVHATPNTFSALIGAGGDSVGNKHLLNFPREYANSNKVQFKAKINSAALVGVTSSDRARARTTGVWYNATQANGEYNGKLGDVFAQLGLEARGDGTFRAFAYMETIADPLWETSGTQIFYHKFVTAISPSTYYDFSVERAGNQMIFKIGAETYIHTITTPIYALSPGSAYKSIQGEIRPGTLGLATISFDDIMAEPTSVGSEDSAATAILLQGLVGGFQVTNRDATAELNEPYHGNIGDSGTPLKSVWFDWVAPESGSFTFDTNGSNFDTLLSIYSDVAPAALEVPESAIQLAPSDFTGLNKNAGNDDANGEVLYSEVTFEAVKGTSYYIAIDGFGGATGDVVLNYRSLELVDDGFCFPIKSKSGKIAVICL